MDFTKFGKKLTTDAGILSLMKDLGEAMAGGGDEMVMMGGGNPGKVPEFQEMMRNHLLAICQDPAGFSKLIGSYTPPQGEGEFRKAIAALLEEELGWPIDGSNICLTNGSQTGFFMLFNLLAGEMEDGSIKKIALPMAPEYIGYADLGLCEDLFVATRPEIELCGDVFFKYKIDFGKLSLGDDIGAICISRPTNPTGNVITDGELQRLRELAKEQAIPLIVDSAYGVPFPSMIYTEATPYWDENMIVSLSLSKLGLPAVRTGIIVASPEIIAALTAMNAIMSLSPTSFGAHLALEMARTKEITKVSRDLIYPYYKAKMERAVAQVREVFAGTPCRMHVPEGAMFLWLWFDDLPVTSLELYQRLKKAGVLVVSGHYFFPGLNGDWLHKDQCLRVTYSQDDEDVQRGIAIIAEVVKKIYRQGG